MSAQLNLGRRAVAGVALVGLLATGCGGDTDPAAEATATTTPSLVSEETETVETGALVEDSSVAETRQAPETLAFALNAAENESYTFTQGLGINFGPAGTTFGATDPYAFGEVVDGQMHVRVDLQQFVGQAMSNLSSFGLGPDAPVGESFEVWLDDSTVTMDLQNLTSLDSEVEAASNSPISFDVSAVDQVDLNAIVTQFGQGSIVADPNGLFDAIGSFESMTENGPAVLATEPVTEYVATVKVRDFFDAQGASVTDQLGIVKTLALPGESEAALSELVPAVEALDLDVVVALDADGRVRRIASDMNVTDLIVTMFENSPELVGEDGEPVIELGALFGPDGLQIVLSTWQEFHDYGTATIVETPEAVDVTADADVLFE